MVCTAAKLTAPGPATGVTLALRDAHAAAITPVTQAAITTSARQRHAVTGCGSRIIG
jgi:hypothetical protein